MGVVTRYGLIRCVEEYRRGYGTQSRFDGARVANLQLNICLRRAAFTP